MKTNKKIAVIVILAIAVMLILTGNAQANYQSIGTGASMTNSANTWIIGIRQMESSGKGMGLSEEVDTTTGLATTDANGIDVHLLKNTEYGAIVLLGASDYGKQGSSIEERKMNTGATAGTEVQASSTGNKYGVYELGYCSMETSYGNCYERVAGGLDSFLPNIAPRYINRYTTSKDSARAGDATIETAQWHNTNNKAYANWIASSSNSVFLRGYYSTFSFGGDRYTDDSYPYYARAGVVVGAGL